MCGIVAIVGDRINERRGALNAALAAMSHRGPDGRGLWVSERGDCALGHTRLAVIDIAGPGQPVANEDGSIVAVVNGEFYGFEEERARLVARGHHFRTGGDSELLVHLYEEQQLDVVNRLRGEFAFALWDGRQQRLLVCRDRFGVKPIYVSHHEGCTFIASEVKALLALGVPARWDTASFMDATTMQYPLPGKTLFAGVHALEPGHWLTVTAGVERVQRYWDLDYPRDDERAPIAAAEATDTVRSAIADAVRVRLRADVPIAAQLSGGLDSTAVVTLAARHGQPTCFTLQFDDEQYDESAVAQASAEFLGVPYVRVGVSAAAMVALLDEAVGFGEGLAINGHLPAKIALSRAMRAAGFKVALTGEGADEVFAGYSHFRMDAGVPVAATNAASAGIMLPSGEGLSTRAVATALGYVPSFIAAKATLGWRLRALLRADFVEAHAGRDSFALLMDHVDRAQLVGRHRVDQSSYLWAKLALPAYLLRTLGDGMEMASSVEGRLPFLDHELFAVVRALPVELKIRGGQEKWILRQALRDVLPPAVLNREKRPLLAPRLSQSKAFREMLFELAGPDLPFFDPNPVKALLARTAAMDEKASIVWDPVLLMVATTALLHRRFRLAA